MRSAAEDARHWALLTEQAAFEPGPQRSSESPGNPGRLDTQSVSPCFVSEFRQPPAILLQPTASQESHRCHLFSVRLITLTRRSVYRIGLRACQHCPSSIWMCGVSGYRFRLTVGLGASFINPWLLPVSQTCRLPCCLLQQSCANCALKEVACFPHSAVCTCVSQAAVVMTDAWDSLINDEGLILAQGFTLSWWGGCAARSSYNHGSRDAETQCLAACLLLSLLSVHTGTKLRDGAACPEGCSSLCT